MEINNDSIEEMKKFQEQVSVLEKIAKSKMTREAISRYGNLKVAHPEKAVKAIVAIAQAVQSGLNEEIDDVKFKQILIELNKQN